MKALTSIEWNGGRPKILDQLLLPHKIKWDISRSVKDTAVAIKKMKIRGAPAIGVAAAFGMAQASNASKARSYAAFQAELNKAGAYLKSQRPTAVNLAWAVDHMLAVAAGLSQLPLARAKAVLIKAALDVQAQDKLLCATMGMKGAVLIKKGARVLTHCNTGALATAGIGTALGVVMTAFKQGKKISVWVDETRPYLQGARLTAFELQQAKIPNTLVTDNSAALLMSKGLVDLVIVGADRITARGDVANKIGTYGLAVIAKAHGVPFYVAAPFSTVDLSLLKGEDIPIEERSADEVLLVNGRPIAAKGTRAAHYGFDVTPHHLISAIITEKGILRAPYTRSLKQAFKAS